MDRMTITIARESTDDSALFVMVRINGNALRGILNVDEFFSIKEREGLVPLFTCGCGDFGCGGYFVDVTCSDTALILRNAYHRFTRALQAEFEYHLGWRHVREIAEEILAYLQDIQEHDANATVTSGYVGVNLIERLPEYQNSLLMAP
jgi:hypothetical protein